eukprot:COSAG05_NODE_24527_length_251_cov_0.513158_1_plen_48_part_01
MCADEAAAFDVVREYVLWLEVGMHSFFKQKPAYAILRSDWSSDVCSSD